METEIRRVIEMNDENGLNKMMMNEFNKTEESEGH